jgi:hypothetical protein
VNVGRRDGMKTEKTKWHEFRTMGDLYVIKDKRREGLWASRQQRDSGE